MTSYRNLASRLQKTQTFPLKQVQETLAAVIRLNSICNSTFGFIGSDLNARVALQMVLSLIELLALTSNIPLKRYMT